MWAWGIVIIAIMNEQKKIVYCFRNIIHFKYIKYDF